MAKLPLILVLLAMYFLLCIPHSVSKRNQAQNHILLLTVRGGKHSISVFPDGQIVSSTAPASLYSLFRVQILPKSRITIEAMATESYLCMDDKGRLITKKTERPARNPNVQGKKRKRSPPDPQHCTFSMLSFSRSYPRPWGIYMEVPKSNGTRGRFIAFNAKGRPRRMVKPLNKLKMLQSLAINHVETFKMSDLIRGTFFQRNEGINGTSRFNRGVRKCLRQSDLLILSKLRHRNIGRRIEECVKSERYEACLRRHRKKHWGGRNIMRQDSKQRYSRDLRTSDISSNSMEVIQDLCRNPGRKDQG